jgi:polyisoprenoid-binding protein YceI
MKSTTTSLILMAICAPSFLTAQRPSRSPATMKAAPAPIRLVLAPSGNQARFIAREMLAANTIENDAIGTTTAITGALILDSQGKVDATASRFSVALDSLKSDRSMRDRYIKGRTIETAQFPSAELVIRELPGLPAPLPAAGAMTFTLIGDLTIHGVTKPSSWQVTAVADSTGFAGKASTHFKFEDFNMNQPHVPIVASVQDDIRLEYDFHLVRAPAR